MAFGFYNGVAISGVSIQFNEAYLLFVYRARKARNDLNINME
ncbi:hypothetical protein Desmer_3450 [Desulfosporosinus meridiei DSM 13257]|uniref:Uncharacterized protein n=1 Tax=Desulfosporosinus meridiei (strain ATCC BAA-275 / DSM 13257 / KCTC 12902 / NCIMB 13706 / S10) TaxID=768704 RepID=J7J2X6_DESMD|nr:hypothetical protein Desmer_3450 [Desulfosporosinus meridiei DSM 13257]